MQNLPNIIPTEVAVVCAALLLLCIAPAVLAWSDRRRRRRVQMQAAAAAAAAAAGGEAVESAWSPPQVAAAGGEPFVDHLASAEAGPLAPPEPHAPTSFEGIVETIWPGPEPLPVTPEPKVEPVAPREPESVLTEQVNSEAVTPPSAAPEPASHQFKLQELRRVRLRDWPPPAVRNDPERLRIWQEAEALFYEQQAAINAVVLVSAVRAQSCCLGAADVDGTRYRLRFFLFPVLWPVADDQAVAQAIFEIDRSGGEMRSWVEPLQR